MSVRGLFAIALLVRQRNLWGPSDRLDGFATGLIVGQGTEIRLVVPRLIAFFPLRTR